MSEPLYIPEEHLEEVVELIRFAIRTTKKITPSVRKNLRMWCDEQEDYLKELEDDE
jgi:hypothetical protein